MANRKSQVSFEFLTVYGWAFLTVLIVIGTMSYFGFFNMQKYLPEKCEFGQNIICEDWVIKDSGANFDVTLKLKNNLEKSIEPVAIKIFNKNREAITCVGNVFCPFESSNVNWTDPDGDGQLTQKDPDKWFIGMSCRFEFTNCVGGLFNDPKETLFVNLTFKRKTGIYNHTITGKVFSAVR